MAAVKQSISKEETKKHSMMSAVIDYFNKLMRILCNLVVYLFFYLNIFKYVIKFDYFVWKMYGQCNSLQ